MLPLTACHWSLDLIAQPTTKRENRSSTAAKVAFDEDHAPRLVIVGALPRRRAGVATSRSEVARPAGLEPAAPSLEGSCSIQLSYGRVDSIVRRTPRPTPSSEPSDKLADFQSQSTRRMKGPCLGRARLSAVGHRIQP